MDDVKRIVVLLIDRRNHSNWSIVFQVGVNPNLKRISDYIKAATSEPTLQGMQSVGIMEVTGSDHGDIAHGTIFNRWF